MTRGSQRLPELEDVDVEHLADEVRDDRRDEELSAAAEHLRELRLRKYVDASAGRAVESWRTTHADRHPEADEREEARASPPVKVVDHVGQEEGDGEREDPDRDGAERRLQRLSTDDVPQEQTGDEDGGEVHVQLAAEPRRSFGRCGCGLGGVFVESSGHGAMAPACHGSGRAADILAPLVYLVRRMAGRADGAEPTGHPGRKAELEGIPEMPKEGDVIAGKFRVERVMAKGGMGVVFAALHLTLGQRVAVKMLLPDAMLVASSVERFQREAQAAANIPSDHVVRIMDVGTTDEGAPYMVMEYLVGCDRAISSTRARPSHRRRPSTTSSRRARRWRRRTASGSSTAT